MYFLIIKPVSGFYYCIDRDRNQICASIAIKPLDDLHLLRNDVCFYEKFTCVIEFFGNFGDSSGIFSAVAS